MKRQPAQIQETLLPILVAGPVSVFGLGLAAQAPVLYLERFGMVHAVALVATMAAIFSERHVQRRETPDPSLQPTCRRCAALRLHVSPVLTIG